MHNKVYKLNESCKLVKRFTLVKLIVFFLTSDLILHVVNVVKLFQCDFESITNTILNGIDHKSSVIGIVISGSKSLRSS